MAKPELTKEESLNLEARLLEIFQLGHENAIGLKSLCKRLGEKDDRGVRLAIENLRNQGYMILFAQKKVVKDKDGKKQTYPAGYFLRKAPEESQEFIEYMRSRVISECKIIRSIKLAEQKQSTHQFGQLPLFFN